MCVFVPIEEWTKLKNEAYVENKEDTFLRHICEQKSNKSNLTNDYKSENIVFAKRFEKRLSTKDVEEFINRTKRTLEEKKTMPFEIKRAVFLSNVFTETSNQLKFKKVLQHVRNEQKNKENKLINDEENKYRIMKREHEENVSKNKFLTGRSLKNELYRLQIKKKEQQTNEIKEQRKELSNIENHLNEKKEKLKLQDVKRKQELRKVFLKDLQQKREIYEMNKKKTLQENNFAMVQSQFAEKINILKKNEEKMIMKRNEDNIFKNFLNAPVSIYSGKVKTKTPEINFPFPHFRIDEIEKRSELNRKKLKEERIAVYNEEMREISKRKLDEKYEKQIEFEQRLRNINTTNLLKERKNRELLDRRAYYKNIWDEQCKEKKLRYEKEKLEDIRRLEKLRNDTKKENEDFLKAVNAILQKFKEQEKNTFPILKCIREFEKSKMLKLKPNTCRR